MLGNNLCIAAVVVTFNRKKLLINCLNAIKEQQFKPYTVYIVDNASTDGTSLYLEERGYKHTNAGAMIIDGIIFHYLRLNANVGGAGGFYTGMKAAHEAGIFDAIWVMDDDGEPDRCCLQNLVEHMDEYAFISPLVISTENRENLSFRKESVSEIKDLYPDGLIPNYANPFNGILFRKDLVDKIGFPKAELFIWGDENEYQSRAIKYGYRPVTIIEALHYHPKDRMRFYCDFKGRESIVWVSSKLRNYCYYRNRIYIIKKYRGLKTLCSFYFRYCYFFLISQHMDLKGLLFFLRATLDGLREKFTGHLKYLS